MLYKCPYCGGVWKPRVVKPRACPLCHRYFNYSKGRYPEEFEGELSSKKLPTRSSYYYTFERSLPCDFCGENHKKFIIINNTRYCRNCVNRLLEESEQL